MPHTFTSNPNTFRIHFLLFITTIFASLVFGDDETIYADFIRVDKANRTMTLWSDDQVLKTYKISLGDNPVGHKQEEGDERTPEGDYVVDFRNPQSRYHLSLHINYPNEKDKAAAAARGVSPGGDIFIHGLPNGYGKLPLLFTGRDWTDGCIAVTNREIEEIWKLVKNGTPISIR